MDTVAKLICEVEKLEAVVDATRSFDPELAAIARERFLLIRRLGITDTNRHAPS